MLPRANAPAPPQTYTIVAPRYPGATMTAVAGRTGAREVQQVGLPSAPAPFPDAKQEQEQEQVLKQQPAAAPAATGWEEEEGQRATKAAPQWQQQQRTEPASPATPMAFV